MKNDKDINGKVFYCNICGTPVAKILHGSKIRKSCVFLCEACGKRIDNTIAKDVPSFLKGLFNK